MRCVGICMRARMCVVVICVQVSAWGACSVELAANSERSTSGGTAATANRAPRPCPRLIHHRPPKEAHQPPPLHTPSQSGRARPSWPPWWPPCPARPPPPAAAPCLHTGSSKGGAAQRVRASQPTQDGCSGRRQAAPCGCCRMQWGRRRPATLRCQHSLTCQLNNLAHHVFHFGLGLEVQQRQVGATARQPARHGLAHACTDAFVGAGAAGCSKAGGASHTSRCIFSVQKGGGQPSLAASSTVHHHCPQVLLTLPSARNHRHLRAKHGRRSR